MKSDYERAIVSPGDTLRIIEALINPLHKVLVLLVACTGLRASEAVGLRWGDLGCFKRGQLAKELEKIVFRLQRGEISDVLRTKQGW